VRWIKEDTQTACVHVTSGMGKPGVKADLARKIGCFTIIELQG
jgi:hypothetical protein